MYDKYKKLQDVLKNTIIRAKEGKFKNSEGEESDSIVIDITGEMKLRDLKIYDESLLSTNNKEKLEQLIVACFQKAQNKAQEVASEKTKDVLGFDPSNMGNLLGGGGIPGLS